MGLLDLLLWRSPSSELKPGSSRAFVTGASVDQVQTYYGVDNSTYQPPEYADYPATSNGVYACVTVRANTVASLPLKIYQIRSDGSRDEVTTGPVVALFQKVNPHWTLSRLLNMTEQSLGIWGECFWFLSKRGRLPDEIWWARADRVKVHPHPTDYISHFTYEPGNGQTPIRFERDEVVWFRYPNPADQFSGLSPLAAARLAADTASAAMHSNFNIFRNGVQSAGMIVPKSGTNFTNEQAKEVADHMDRRFRGVDKAHRIGVMRFDADFKQLSMTPHDAEFLGALNWSMEDIARAYHVPIDKIGGKRTYQNVEESERVYWNDCIIPEVGMIAAEITEQLLPMFGPNLIAEFDTSDVNVLQDDEAEKWAIWSGKIEKGVATINEFRAEEGLDPVAWGDVFWGQATIKPITDGEKPEPLMLTPGNAPEPTPPPEPERTKRGTRAMFAYGSREHETYWRAQMEPRETWEDQIARTVADLFNRQKASILAGLRSYSKREIDPYNPIDQPRWIKTFRTEVRPIIADVTYEAGKLAADQLGFAFNFNVQDPNIIRAIENQVQRFAVEVNDTTWRLLRDSLSEGIAAGEGTDALAVRVEDIMADRIRSSKDTIARTEANTASNQGTLESWRQSGVVREKEWLAALDERTRSSHIEAHGQRVAFDDDFFVGACSGPSPGHTGCAGEDINCRCVMVPVLDVQP